VTLVVVDMYRGVFGVNGFESVVVRFDNCMRWNKVNRYRG